VEEADTRSVTDQLGIGLERLDESYIGFVLAIELNPRSTSKLTPDHTSLDKK
jgi:hypothetical protein